MARLALLVAFLAGLLVIGNAGPLTSRILKSLMAGASSAAGSESNDPNAMASASATAMSTGGMTVAEAFSSTEITEMAGVEINKMWVEFQKNVTDESTCEEVIAAADVAVDAQVAAVAEVYSSAFGTVTVQGTGSGCVNAEASGDATADAFLQVIIELIVGVNFPDEDTKDGAFARAFGNLVGAATASAWAEAFITGCAAAEDGNSFILAEQTSFARATAVPTISAFAWAEAGAACGEQAFSNSEIVGEVMIDGNVTADTASTTIVEGEGTADAAGGSGANVQEITDENGLFQARIAETAKCRGTFTFCCRTSVDETCHCTSSKNMRLFKCNAVATEGPDKVLWVDEELDQECYCDK